MILDVSTRRASNKLGTLLATNINGSDPFRSQAETDYAKKKAAQKHAIHREILRVSMEQIKI